MLWPQYFIREDLFSDLATYLNMIHYFRLSLNAQHRRHTLPQDNSVKCAISFLQVCS
jgi:hypothetical protein